jgi:hypothetical protein
VDSGSHIIGCRFQGVDSDELLNINDGVILYCTFIGNGSNVGVLASIAIGGASAFSIDGCTFYNLATAIELANAAHARGPIITNCHATDCTKWIDNLYTGTSAVACIEHNNRTRDNTTPRTGVGDGVNAGEVTTDTGGIATDYVDAGAGNFRLITGAPGLEAGMIAYSDIGAYQKQPSASGGGLIRHPGMNGGLNG